MSRFESTGLFVFTDGGIFPALSCQDSRPRFNAGAGGEAAGLRFGQRHRHVGQSISKYGFQAGQFRAIVRGDSQAIGNQQADIIGGEPPSLRAPVIARA